MSLLEGLAKGAAGLDRNKTDVLSLLAVAFGLPRRFALCLSSSTMSDDAIFFSNGPYEFRGTANQDASQGLTYTLLLVNPMSTAGVSSQGEKSAKYFIGVKSIRINGKALWLNATLLAIDKKIGTSGTKINMVNP
ncbi:hypothetical protein Cni_G09352 [Canna indica]|uniref:Xylanase inhibitor C-terminal domain-containing protein n=1 Tax=Canna indica TaxID=4628 RepID=A0AAQ3K262_9LILI|nr:hypothetical protein Cni_G09352 [Canna indica]